MSQKQSKWTSFANSKKGRQIRHPLRLRLTPQEALERSRIAFDRDPLTIYREFAKRKDHRNHPFQISHKQKGLLMRDQWDELKKVELYDMRKFIEHWFVLAEKTEHNGKPVLLIVTTLPVMSIPLFCQGRYLTRELIDLFPVVD